MTSSYRLPSSLETFSFQYLMQKYFYGLFFFAFGFALLNKQHPIFTGLFSLPFFALSTFFLTLTRVKPEPDVIKYRRFFRWSALPYEEIVECRKWWVLGFIVFRRKILPWGRVYFVRQLSGIRWDIEMIRFIRSKAHLPD